MTHQHGDILLVEVPEGCNEWDIFNIDGRNYLNGIDDEGKMEVGVEPLPPGDYSILGLAKDLTEAQWEEIVESDTRVDGYGFHHIATASGLSIVASYGIKPGNCLILKKK